MTVTELKEQRDAIEKTGIGVYLPVVKQLFSMIDKHVAADTTTTVSDVALQAKATSLQTRVNELETEIEKLKAENTMLTTVAKEAIKDDHSAPQVEPEPTKTEA